MPIYAYKCGSCGHAKDVLQKISDPALRTCPSCGADAFSKQVTAAGFQLKGSGWYATDFRSGGNGSAAASKSEDKAADSGSKSESTPAAPKSDAPSAAAGGCGGSCACH